MQYCEHLLVAFTVSVLVFYYCTANHLRFSGLIQHTFIILVSVLEESGYSLDESSAEGLTRLQ